MIASKRFGYLSISILLVSTGCGDSSEPEPLDPQPRASRVVTEGSDALRTSSVDATDSMGWVYMALARDGVEVTVNDPSAELNWDLAFRRSNIRLNGGDGGPGEAAVVPLSGTSFDAVTEAPEAGWVSDELSGAADPDGAPVMSDGFDFAFTRENSISTNGWFDYNPATHVLSPAEVVWAVRGAGGDFYALEIVDWYDSFGTSAVWNFRWKRIAAPSGG